MKIKVLELFGGIGACSKALERLGIDYEIADYVEIDKYAVKSFNAIHGTNFEPQDITTWDKDIEVDLVMHGSPCQSISLAGLQHGADKGSGTRSSLMWETVRIVEKLKPRYVIWENVKNLLSKKHRHNFDAYLETMEQLGYTNYYQVLNAKDYGIPQNRERVFTVSILGNEKYDFPQERKLDKMPIDFVEEDADEKYNLTDKNIKHYQREFGSKGKELDLYEPIPTLTASMGTGGGNIPYFTFPPKQELKLKLKDMLEDEVDEKYYLSDKMIQYISATGTANFKNPDSKINLDVARPLTTDQNKRAGTTNYLSDDLPDNYNLSILIKNNTKKGYLEAYEGDGVDISGRMQWHRGTVQKQTIQTITTNQGYGVVVKDIRNMKEKLCDELVGGTKLQREVCNKAIEKKLVEPNDVIEYTYSNARLKEIDNNTIRKQNKADNQIMSTLVTKPDKLGVVVKSAYSDLEKQLFTEDGNIKRYINSDVVDEFKEGQMATTSFPNGYGHGPRTHDESICLNCIDKPSVKHNLRIRKLTPKECWRLMGFDDIDFEKAAKVNSNSQLYKQAGNSIVVNVLEAILKELLLTCKNKK